VSNTGPLVALAKIDALGLLKNPFGRVHIEPAVHRGLLAKTSLEADRLDDALNDFLEIRHAPAPARDVSRQTHRLGAGEGRSIILALALGEPLLIDERVGRAVARSLGLRVVGSGAVLIRAKQRRLITSVRGSLEEMRGRGYWLSEDLIGTAAKLAGE